MLKTTTPEERRAFNERMRVRCYDSLTKLIDAASHLRASMGPAGYDDEGEEYRDFLRATYDVVEIDAIWDHLQSITPDEDEWDGRDALGFSNADSIRIKDDRNRVDY